MYASAVCEARVVTVVSCVLKASYFIHRDFTTTTVNSKLYCLAVSKCTTFRQVSIIFNSVGVFRQLSLKLKAVSLDLQTYGLKNVRLVMNHHWDKLHTIRFKGKSVTSF